MKRHRAIKWAALLFVTGFLVLNFMAWHHAGAMFTYVATGDRTERPHKLGLLEKVRVLLFGITLPRPMAHDTPRGLDAQTITIESPNGTLSAWYIPKPGAQTLCMLLHGYGAEKSSLLQEARAVYEMGHSVLLLDFYGSGDSSGDTNSLGYHEAADVVSALAHMRAHYPESRQVLIGFSMGSVAALRAIGDLGATCDAIIVHAVFDDLVNTVKNRFRLMGVPAFPSAQLLVFWGSQRLQMNGFQHSPMSYASGITAPCLVMQGGRDDYAKPEDARRVFDALNGEKEWVLFEQAAHESYLKVDPDTWRTTVRTFLEEVSAPNP
ncbi:MAG: alpha-beta hydrolase superfamily lysophospholipase [Kiritimatiellia bacterium]